MTVMVVRGHGTVRSAWTAPGMRSADAGHARALREGLARCVAAARQAGGGRAGAGPR